MGAVVFAAWCAVVWRARGGAFAAVTGIDLGTQPTRIACGMLIAAPLAWFGRDAWLLGLAPALFLGLVAVGWAAFMAYGADGNVHVAGSPFDWLARVLRIPTASAWTDAVGWLQIGPACLAPSAALLAALRLGWWWLAVPAVGFAGVYAACDAAGARGWLRYRRALDTPEAWAELVMGAVIGAALWKATGS